MNAPPAVARGLELEPTVRGARLSWLSAPPESSNTFVVSLIAIASLSETAPVIDEFARGSLGQLPSREVVDVARRLVAEATRKTEQPEITVDVDGALSFDLRLNNGRLMFAELAPDGTLSLSVFDDSRDEIRLLSHVPSASELQFSDHL